MATTTKATINPAMQSMPATWLAQCVVICLALAGCAEMGSGGTSGSSETSGSGMSGQSGSSEKSDSGYHEGNGGRSHRDTESKDTSGTGTTSGPGTSGGMAAADAPMAGWRGVVQSIEPMSRQEAGIGVGGSLGAAAAGGMVAGTGGSSDKVYRVTLRTDDGSSRSMVVETPPDYQVGDRVGYNNGSMQRQ